MQMIPTLVILFSGLVMLIAGGEALTRGAASAATIMGVRQIIIGLTIVAFGTSMPEACVSIMAALDEKNDISVANVAGSNIFNIAFIIGLCALVKPIRIEESLIRREIPFVIGATLMFGIMSLDHLLSRLDGLVLFIFFLVFLWMCFATAIPEAGHATSEPSNDTPVSKLKSAMLIIGGLFLMVAGARFFVNGAYKLALSLGVSELFIGLTIVAIGTSLPELVTSAMASFRQKDDLAVGNVIGSNIFNILFILGLSSMILPLNVSHEVLIRDIPSMIFLAILSLVFFKSGLIISRLEGALLMSFQCFYSWVLFQFL